MNKFLLASIAWLALACAHAATPVDAALAAYERGDLPRARAAFTRLSAQGNAAADYNLAVMHLRREMPRSSDREALRLMQRAADSGFGTAMAGLADLHEQGGAGLPVNLEQSVQWNRRAADAGSVDAQVNLATAFFLGRGAPKDAKQAAHWYRRAAQGGDVGAMYIYASMAEAGDGVERDFAEARYWYAAAARNGDEAAPSKVIELDAKLAKPAI